MTSVYLKCTYAGVTIDLKRHNPPQPADTLHVNEGTFALPPGRRLTIVSDLETYGREVTIQAVDGDILVNGIPLKAGSKTSVSVTRKNPVTLLGKL